MKKTFFLTLMLMGALALCYSQTGTTPQGLEYRITSSSVEITAYSGNATQLVIPTQIQGLPVKSIGDYAFRFSSITSITIPSSVISIGDWAFAYCNSLVSITIPSSVTSIGDWAFAGCSSLRSIIIPSSVNSIGNRAFIDCSSLISITIPSSVTYIGDGVFNYCRSLRSITVDVQNPVYASIDGVLFDKNIHTIIAYPNTRNSVYTIPSSVTSIGNDAFFSCSSLVSITIPSSVSSIGNGAFGYCSNLENITIPSSVTYIGDGAFGHCSSLRSITVDSQNPFYTSIDGVLFDKAINTIIAYPNARNNVYTIPSSVTSIGNDAFFGCSSLVSITLPSSVTFIGHRTFSGCSSLVSITIPSSVTSIGDFAFQGCSNLRNIIIPSSVRSIGRMALWLCDSLTSITLSRQTQVGEGAFPPGAQIIYSD